MDHFWHTDKIQYFLLSILISCKNIIYIFTPSFENWQPILPKSKAFVLIMMLPICWWSIVPLDAYMITYVTQWRKFKSKISARWSQEIWKLDISSSWSYGFSGIEQHYSCKYQFLLEIVAEPKLRFIEIFTLNFRK